MRCYFHLVSHDSAILDETGVEFSDLREAEAEALRALQQLREEDDATGEDWRGWQLSVTDWAGQVLLPMPLMSASQGPKLRPLPQVSCFSRAIYH